MSDQIAQESIHLHRMSVEIAVNSQKTIVTMASAILTVTVSFALKSDLIHFEGVRFSLTIGWLLMSLSIGSALISMGCNQSVLIRERHLIEHREKSDQDKAEIKKRDAISRMATVFGWFSAAALTASLIALSLAPMIGLRKDLG